MIVKGRSVSPGHGNNLANYLLRDRKNESSELVQLRGSAGKSLDEAVQEWSLTAAGTRCKLPIYSASINPQGHEKLSRQQYLRAADILEEKLGLTGQPRAVVIQVNDKGREHAHVIWSRIDLVSMRAISDSNNFRKHELAARAIEREFGLQHVQGAHIEREPGRRRDRTPTHAELQQGDRGVPPREAKQLITELWRGSDNGQAFKAALEHKGWILARGDRRDWVLIDPFSTVHSLARRVEGARAADIRHKLADLDRELVPGVAEARRIMRERNPGLTRTAPEKTHRHHQQRHTNKEFRNENRPSAPIRAQTPQLHAPKIHGIPGPTRSVVKLAGKALDGLASLFEGLLGGGPAHPERKTEQDIKREQQQELAQQPTQRERDLETSTEQALADLTRRRQDFARTYGYDQALEPMTDQELDLRRRQRERDDRERSR